MRRLNREFRGKHKSTDVLSFPAARNGKLAGDIAISRDIARQNAKILGHSLGEEVKILLLHGLLHLAGHDHETDDGEMAELEQRLRARLKLPRGLIERASAGIHRGHAEKRRASVIESGRLLRLPVGGRRTSRAPDRERVSRMGFSSGHPRGPAPKRRKNKPPEKGRKAFPRLDSRARAEKPAEGGRKSL